MRNFTCFALAAMTALSVSAAAAAPFGPIGKASAGDGIRFRAPKTIMKLPAPVEEEPVYEQPEGEFSFYSRNCDSFTAVYYDATHGMDYGSVVRVVTQDDGTVWINHSVSGYYTQAWVKATREGDKISMTLPQPIGEYYDDWEDEYYTVYLVPMDYCTVTIDGETYGSFEPAENPVVTFTIGEDGAISADNQELLLGVCTYGYVGDDDFYDEEEYSESGDDAGDEYAYVWSGYGDRFIKLAPAPTDFVTVPEGLEIERWTWMDQYDYAFANVAIDDANSVVYVSGMDRSLPDAYVKGEIRGDKVVFPSGQYLGPDEEIMYMSYFCGAEFTFEEDPDSDEPIKLASLTDAATFTFDREGKSLILEDGYVINSDRTILFPLYSYDSVSVEFQNRNPEAAPEPPYDLSYNENWDSFEFRIPNIDVDGNLLDTDRLYYEIYFNGDIFTFSPEEYAPAIETETTLVPYAAFDNWNIFAEGSYRAVYFYNGAPGTIGVRSVYINENDEHLVSDLSQINTGLGVDAAEVGKEVEKVETFDMTGRRVAADAQGIVIRKTTYSDGTSETVKVAVR